MSEWHYSNDGSSNRGPVSLETITELLKSGDVHADTLVWRAGQPDWVRLSESSLAQLTIRAPRPKPATTPASAHPPGASSCSAAGDWSVLTHTAGPAVSAKDFVAPGTGRQVLLAWIVALVGAPVLAALAFNPVVLVALIVSAISAYFLRRRMQARIHGSAILVSEKQFPEIHACVEGYSKRLGLAETPVTYVYEASFINALAMRIGGRGYVMLTDDIVDACARSGDMRTLQFIVGHELAHHALGHTGWLRAWARTFNSRLSRLDEFSCDAIGAALNGHRPSAAHAMLLLVSGPQLFRRINFDAIDAQAAQVVADKHSLRAETKQSHPLPLRRYAALRDGWAGMKP